MSSTTAPAVIAALVAGVKARLPSTVQVGNASLYRTLADDVVVVGFAPEGAAIEATQTPVVLGGSSQESYDVHSLASSRRPMLMQDADFASAQAQVFAVKDAFEDFLMADPSMGDLVAKSFVSAWSYSPDTTDQGVVADLPITVHIEAFRS